jgi:hypothetical protein
MIDRMPLLQKVNKLYYLNIRKHRQEGLNATQI